MPAHPQARIELDTIDRNQACHSSLRLVHETPNRLRFKLRLLGDPTIDFSWLETRLLSVRGVGSARINRRAHSAIIDYEGLGSTRTQIVALLGGLVRNEIPSGKASPSQPAQLAPVIQSGAVVLALPLLPQRARFWATLLNISGTFLLGVETLLTRGVKVEVLDAVATGITAWRGQYLAANVTHFLMKLGAYLEQRTQRESDHLLRRLLAPEPVQAWVERGDALVQLPDIEIQARDRVRVGVGERIPIDGLVLGGAALVNQAAITGESVPIRKEVMDRVIAGSIVVDGQLRVEARRVGTETTTARIARFIDASLSQSSDTQRLAERLADQRVFLTLITGAAIYALTGDERRLASIFLVDYSCALKLGTPLAFKSGMFHAASAGALLKGGKVIEQLASVDTVLFDKTGTLTHSRLTVTDVMALDEARWSRTRLLAITASIEEHGTHPIAEAIVRKAREEKLNHIDHGEVDYLVAHGMRCSVAGEELLIGSRHYLEEHEGVSFAEHRERLEVLRSEGKTLLYVGTRSAPIGVIALRDTLRAEAAEVLGALRKLGVRHVAITTGDQRVRAETMARTLGIDEVFAEQEPEDKVRVLAQLQAEGRKVAFVGDGVNDGPALIAADVGIAMSRGAELARATADAILLEDHLSSLVDALATAQKTMSLVRTNYQAAIGINTAVMVGAAMGWLSPVVSAALHNGTTVALLLRALRGLGQVTHSAASISDSHQKAEPSVQHTRSEA